MVGVSGFLREGKFVVRGSFSFSLFCLWIVIVMWHDIILCSNCSAIVFGAKEST